MGRWSGTEPNTHTHTHAHPADTQRGGSDGVVLCSRALALSRSLARPLEPAARSLPAGGRGVVSRATQASHHLALTTSKLRPPEY